MTMNLHAGCLTTPSSVSVSYIYWCIGNNYLRLFNSPYCCYNQRSHKIAFLQLDQYAHNTTLWIHFQHTHDSDNCKPCLPQSGALHSVKLVQWSWTASFVSKYIRELLLRKRRLNTDWKVLRIRPYCYKWEAIRVLIRTDTEHFFSPY